MPEPFDSLALVVGISRYDRLPLLPVVTDADDVAGILRDPALCGYQHVQTLIDAQASRDAILQALDRVADVAPPGSSVFFYFSGHGGRVSEGEWADCYLMPVGSTWRSPEDTARTAISGTDLSKRVRRMSANRVTIVLDCCRAAGIVNPDAGEPSAIEEGLPSEALTALSRGRGRAVLAASRADGVANVISGRSNSVFTRHLLDGLRGAAGGTGGVIRICDLFHYVQQKVAAEIPRQRPVFKAQLEENYPVALYRGGRPTPFALPALDDGFAYDAFVSFRRVQPDSGWVNEVLVPKLEQAGLRLCLEDRDFRLGAPQITEMERAVERSRYTIAVLTPRYLEGAFQEFEQLLARHHALETRAPRFIPLIREACHPALGIRMAAVLDVSESELEEATLQRLALQLREPHRMPLSG